MSELKGAPGNLRFTMTVVRKATGRVETYDVIGTPAPESARAESTETEDQDNVGHPQHRGA